jgi:hypothetical protein
MAVGIRHADHMAPSIRKFQSNFDDKRRSIGRYSSLVDSSHGVFLFIPDELQAKPTNLFCGEDLWNRRRFHIRLYKIRLPADT